MLCFQAIVDDLERRQNAIEDTKDAAARILEGEEDPEKIDECKWKWNTELKRKEKGKVLLKTNVLSKGQFWYKCLGLCVSNILNTHLRDNVLIPDFPCTGEELRSKLQQLDDLQSSIREATSLRGEDLKRARIAADEFSKNHTAAVQALRNIQDTIESQDLPHIEPAIIQSQQQELEVRDTKWS